MSSSAEKAFAPLEGSPNPARKMCEKCVELQEMTTALEDYIGRTNEQLLKSEMSDMELEQIFSACVDPMIVIRDDGIIVRANRRMMEHLDRCCEEVIGVSCTKLLSEQECSLALSRKKNGQTDIEIIGDDGEVKNFIMTTSHLITLDGTPGTLAQYTDITDRKKAEQALEKAHAALERIARIDGLTQIPNRRTFDESFMEQWQKSLSDQSPLSIILCDIDFFKRYNDTYGHQEGDTCLSSVAQALEQSLSGNSSGLVARYGGEEFIFLLPDVSADEAVAQAETARRHVEQLALEHQASDVAEHVTLSLGVSTTVPQDGIQAQHLIRTADEALYQSKEAGRNRVTAVAFSG
nr:sensor domain-containing diguanylate cyclase [uncultured Desulfuromonas sp.]